MADFLDLTEQCGIGLLVIGFAIAALSREPFILYTTCFLMGLLFGRIWYRRKGNFTASLFMLIMFFFLGFILGGFYANLTLLTILLAGGIILSYWLHDRGIIRSIEF